MASRKGFIAFSVVVFLLIIALVLFFAGFGATGNTVKSRVSKGSIFVIERCSELPYPLQPGMKCSLPNHYFVPKGERRIFCCPQKACRPASGGACPSGSSLSIKAGENAYRYCCLPSK